MSDAFGIEYGIESPAPHPHVSHRPPARYLVVIETAGIVVARLFLESCEQVAEFDASAEEVAVMTKGLLAAKTAHCREWDEALGSHSAEERSAADVYTLDL